MSVYDEAIENLRFLKAREQSQLISKRIIEDLTDRGGFDAAWNACDEDIQKEIQEAFAEIALTILQNV